MKTSTLWLAGLLFAAIRGEAEERAGPAAALAFAEAHRGEVCAPSEVTCFPAATGISWAECEHVIPMTAALWRPEDIRADFERRNREIGEARRKRGIIVLLKTERCAVKIARLCTVTTAALEKRATPLAAEFEIYGVWLKPRDDDEPAGSRAIETGGDAWKNEAAGCYRFRQGPGATLVFLDPQDGSVIERTDAVRLKLFDEAFTAARGETPLLHAKLGEILQRIQRRQRAG